MPTINHPINKQKTARLVHNTYPGNKSISELQNLATEEVGRLNSTVEKVTEESERLDSVYLNPIDWKIPEGTIDTGNVTSGTINSLTDTTKTWTPDGFKDKICKIFRNGGTDFCYAIIESNTEDTLQFDDELLVIPCETCGYTIIHSLVLEETDLPTLVAIDSIDGKGGVILPKSVPAIERRRVHAYIEKGTFGDIEVPILCREQDRQRGAKYGVLADEGEGVSLYVHQWVVPHYDVVSTYNITKTVTGYWNEAAVINNTPTFVMQPDPIVITDFAKRFIPIERDGAMWLRYTSLLPDYFYLLFSATIEKTGSAGEASIYWRVKYAKTGLEEDLIQRIAQTRFGGGAGLATIAVEAPAVLNRNDEVTAIAIKTDGNLVIDDSSYFKIVKL